MATPIITTPIWKTLTGTTTTADDAKYDAICRAVDATIKNTIQSNIFRQSYTLYLDAPPSYTLVLPQKPAILAGLVVLRHFNSKGDPTLFNASTDTLILYTDYILETDRDNELQSESGILRCLTGWWGQGTERSSNTLASRVTPDYKAVKVTYSGGLSSCPADLQLAAAQVVSIVAKYIPDGVPYSSESWNGWSGSQMLTLIQNGLVQNPLVWSTVQKFAPRGGINIV